MTAIPSSNSSGSPRLQRLVVVSRNRVQGWRKSKGMSDTKFLKRCGLSTATYYRMKREKPVELSSARLVADAMGLSDVREILVDGEAGPPEAPSPSLPLAVDEWDITEPIDGWVQASNGLN